MFWHIVREYIRTSQIWCSLMSPRCVKGVWKVSGGCLVGVWKVSGGTWIMFWEYQCQIMDENQLRAIMFIFCLFIQCPPIGKITKNCLNFQTPGTGVKTKLLTKTDMVLGFYT